MGRIFDYLGTEIKPSMWLDDGDNTVAYDVPLLSAAMNPRIFSCRNITVW